MLMSYENRSIFIASEPVDFRMSIDGLSAIVQREMSSHIHDGSIYVFFNANENKVKCLFWDTNGFVLYYKRFYDCRLKLKKLISKGGALTATELDGLLAGLEPEIMKSKPLQVINNG